MSTMYVCRKCGRQHSQEESEDSRFCRNCGTFLFREKRGESINGSEINQDIGKAQKIGKTIHDAFRTRAGFFRGYLMPEYILPEGIEEEGSIEHALYLTFVISIDYQTDAMKLWQNARQTYLESPETFNPRNIVNMNLETLSAILKDMGARYPTNGAKAWRVISWILLEKYKGDPRNITPTPLTIAQVKRFIERFPHLRGKKLSNFYLRAMGEKDLFRISDLEELDIPVDVQVARFTFCTGCLKLKERPYSACIHEPPIQPAIESVWREAAKGLGIAPWQLDEPMWTIGSQLCTSRSCTRCPVKALCDRNFDIRIRENSIFWE